MSAVSLRQLLCCSMLGGFALPAAALAAQPPVVAVFTLKSDGAQIKTEELDRLSDYIGAALTESGHFQVVPKSEVRAALNAKKKASYKECYAESCQIEVGKELAADKALAGVVARIGSRCTVTLKIVDLRKATEETAARAKGECGSDNVLESLDTALGKLTGVAVRSGRGTASSSPVASVVKGEDYGDLDAEIAAETRKSTAERVAKRARQQAAKKDWAKIHRYVTSDQLTVKRRVQVLQEFLRAFPTDNRYLADAQSVLRTLQTSGMVRVPGGNFYMGCNETVDSECQSDEKPGKTVHVAGFRIDTTEVTVAAYKECVDAGTCAHGTFKDKSDDKYCNWGQSGRGTHPMNCVNWAGADTYCKWAGKRLPRENEWEKATRGTDGRKYAWGNGKMSCAYYAVLDDKRTRATAGRQTNGCGRDSTWPVGSRPAGKSPYGALDMIGNVWEWVEGWRADGKYRALRGGSWNYYPKYARASNRNFNDPAARNSNIGFRCAQSE